MNAKSTLMISAIEEKNLDELRHLVKNGLKLNWMYFPQTVLPLVVAAQTGDIDLCRAIVKLGAHLHACKGLPSPLSNAVYLNFKTAVKVLIEIGCDVNEYCIRKDWFKKTPRRVQEWLRKSASNFLQCPTILGLAILMDNYDLATILLEAGADINQADNDSEHALTPIHLLCDTNWARSCNFNAVMEFFHLRPSIRPTPDLECKTKLGETPLMIAAKSNNIEAVNYLLEQKVALNIETHCNHTALHYAVDGGSPHQDDPISEKIIVSLLRAGCAIDEPHWKDSPISFKDYLNDQICEIFVKFGADPLRYKGARKTSLHLAAAAGNLILMEMTLRAGICVDAMSVEERYTPLMLSYRCLVTTKYLIQQKMARLDLEGDRGETALHDCLVYGPTGVCAYLVIEGSPRCLNSYRMAEAKPRVMELLLLTEALPLGDLMAKHSDDWKKYASGWHGSWTETTFYQLSRAMASNAHSLKHLCRLTIRDALTKHSGGRGILLSIECLPFPSILKKYICYLEELNRLKLSKILNTDDDDDDDVDFYNDNRNAIRLNDRRYHRHRQRERAYDQIDDIIQETERLIDY